MGSWAETDLLTQLPINAGDKIRAFVIVKRLDEDYHYPTSAWMPITNPISGAYDDYGCIENFVLTLDLTSFIEKLKPLISLNERASYLLSVENKNVKDLSELEIINLISEDGTYLDDKPLRMIFILDKIYQASVSFEDKKSINIIKKDLKSWFETITDARQSYSSLDDFAKLAKAFSCEAFPGFSCDGFGHPARKNLIDLVWQNKSFKDKDVKAACKEALEACSLDYFMRLARKHWAPQSGKGSKNDDLNAHEVLNQIAAEIIDERYEDED